MQHPEDRTGDEDGLDGEGREEEGREDDGGGGGGMNSMEDAKEEIEAFDWEGLEGRFWDRMEECRKVEEGIREEFAGLIQVCRFFFFSFGLFFFSFYGAWNGAVGLLCTGGVYEKALVSMSGL